MSGAPMLAESGIVSTFFAAVNCAETGRGREFRRSRHGCLRHAIVPNLGEEFQPAL
jgi:hypothetical protein